MERKDRDVTSETQSARGLDTSYRVGLLARAGEHAFFSHGFRPFFLGSSIYAALAMTLWLAWIGLHAANASLTWISIAGPPHVWHAHEMVFGFALAAVAGFLLTAVPNWTSAMPLSGTPLVMLFAIWVAGRLAMACSAFLPASVVAVIDLAFIPALGLHVARQLFMRPQAKNMVFLGILGALFAVNVSYHLAMAELVGFDATAPLRAGVIVLVIIIAIIGGRIVPSFTHNHLKRIAPDGPMPIRSALIDRAALSSLLVLSVLTLLPVNDLVIAAAAGLAAAANAARLAGWRGLSTLSEPIVIVLHVGYLWLVIGLAVWCFAEATHIISDISALHALSTGAVGTMILAVMSRASLGHTGRPIAAPRAIGIAYVLVSLAAALRTFGPALAPSFYNGVMLTSGVLWIAAFGLFASVYAPILTQPRAVR